MDTLQRIGVGAAALLLTFGLLLVPGSSQAQTTTPESIELGSDSDVCMGESITRDASITLPEETTSDKVDILLLADDTGSFSEEFPDLADDFEMLIGNIESSFPDVSFGFGVARFEDYGGPAGGFSGGESEGGRPFILNQPIITADDAGGESDRNTLIEDALDREAPGYGGDGPESAIAEGLYQVASGVGFDGNGDGDTEDSGDAGETSTQTSPGTSGDVPSFDTNVLPASGTQGGVGWREDAQKIVIVATDVCPVSPHATPDIPDNITGVNGSSEPVTALACDDTEGEDRYGFVGDAKSFSANTVTDAVVPSEAGTVQETIDALNGLGIQAVGVGPGAAPTDADGPSFDESVFLSALGRLTGGVDSDENPIVEDVGGDLAGALEDAIETSATAEIDITLTASDLPDGLSFSSSPDVVEDVGPGGTAEFDALFEGDGSTINGSFDLQFRNASSNAIQATIPVEVTCDETGECDVPTLAENDIDQDNRTLSNTMQDDEGVAEFTFTTLDNFTVEASSLPSGYTNTSGNTWEWIGSGDPETSVDFTLDAGDGNTSTYFLEVTDACEDPGPNTTTFDPAFEFGPAASKTQLAGNAPNPFSGQTTVEFDLAERSRVTVAVYDMMGRKVATLVDGVRSAGPHAVGWNGRSDSGQDLASGVYLLRMKADQQSETRRMTIIR